MRLFFPLFGIFSMPKKTPLLSFLGNCSPIFDGKIAKNHPNRDLKNAIFRKELPKNGEKIFSSKMTPLLPFFGKKIFGRRVPPFLTKNGKKPLLTVPHFYLKFCYLVAKFFLISHQTSNFNLIIIVS